MNLFYLLYFNKTAKGKWMQQVVGSKVAIFPPFFILKVFLTVTNVLCMCTAFLVSFILICINVCHGGGVLITGKINVIMVWTNTPPRITWYLTFSNVLFLSSTMKERRPVFINPNQLSPGQKCPGDNFFFNALFVSEHFKHFEIYLFLTHFGG